MLHFASFIKEDQPVVDGEKKAISRLRWMDNIELNLKHMGIKRCRTRALDRRVWVFVMKESLRS
jgi:hypothetical protein